MKLSPTSRTVVSERQRKADVVRLNRSVPIGKSLVEWHAGPQPISVAPSRALLDRTTPMLLSEQMRLVRDQHVAERDTLHQRQAEILNKAATRPDKALLASEQRDFDALKAEKRSIDDVIRGDNERLEELLTQESRDASAAASRVLTGHGASVSEPGIYRRDDKQSPSFFRDLWNAQLGDYDAMERLRRNNQETRALGNTGGTGGSGGEFAPPAWIVDEYVKLARPGRVTADLFHREDLPSGYSSVNLPRVATGTTTAIQSTQNTALSQTDLTTNSLTSNISTIGGKQVVAQQLLDQSPVPFDRVVLEDLAADYAKQLGLQVISGSGASGQLKGYLTPTSASVVTWTQASPTVAGFYGQLANLQQTVITNRFRQPDAVVMHPRRWAWFASGTDSNGRPLVVPDASGASFNTVASSANAVGHVGSVLGMDIFTDPNIPTNLGAGTNQDVVLMFVRDDVWFWESTFRADALREPYGDSLGVLFRLYNYSAMIPDRYLSSLGTLKGTGLTPPTFAS